MAIPAIIWGIIEVVSAAVTAYEMYDLGKSLYEDVEKYSRNLDQAKEELRKQIESIASSKSKCNEGVQNFV